MRHTTAEDVGRAAAAAGVKLVVLSHLVPGDDPSITDGYRRAPDRSSAVHLQRAFGIGSL
jgi:ribonuclease BN (tRNA processing enzyme)